MVLKSYYKYFFFFGLIFLLILYNYKIFITGKPDISEIKEKYISECEQLYKKLRYPNAKFIHDPPVNKIPTDLYNEFTENGTIRVEYIYYNDKTKDSSTDDKTIINRYIKKSELDQWLIKISKDEPIGSYDDQELKRTMFKMSDVLKGKTMAVIGTISVWVEAIALAISCSKITSFDYTRNKYEQKELEWLHVNDYLENSLKNRLYENYDNAASFSSLEHAGLGRFGDPLSPNGDIDAVRQVHCMLKKGGLFFLAIPVSEDDKYFISFNGGIINFLIF